MADQDLINALDDCIAQLAKGQSIDDCLQRHPDQAVKLRPMLETGLLVRRARVNPLEVAQAKDRVRFRLEQHRRRPAGNLWRAVVGIAAALVLMLGGLSVAAESSLPGDALYGLKRVTEGTRLLAAGASPDLQRAFAQRRLDEIARLLALKRAIDVSFEGEVQAIHPPEWRVADLDMAVTPDVPGSQAAAVGDRIQVQASTTTQGTLVARAIVMIKKAAPTALPPTPTATDTATLTPTPTETVSPSPTVTNTATASSTMRSSATFTVTAAPTITRTAVPARTRIATARPPIHPTNTLPPPTVASGGGDDHGGSNNSGSGSGSNSGSGGGSDGGGDDHGGGSNSGSGSSGSNSGSSGGSGSGDSGKDSSGEKDSSR